jgi:hypothetical protein
MEAASTAACPFCQTATRPRSLRSRTVACTTSTSRTAARLVTFTKSARSSKGVCLATLCVRSLPRVWSAASWGRSTLASVLCAPRVHACAPAAAVLTACCVRARACIRPCRILLLLLLPAPRARNLSHSTATHQLRMLSCSAVLLAGADHCLGARWSHCLCTLAPAALQCCANSSVNAVPATQVAPAVHGAHDMPAAPGARAAHGTRLRRCMTACERVLQRERMPRACMARVCCSAGSRRMHAGAA